MDSTLITKSVQVKYKLVFIVEISKKPTVNDMWDCVGFTVFIPFNS